MAELDVRIVKLAPMRVASVSGFGKEPEGVAHERFQAFAGPKGYLDDLDNHRVFGFNNPDPSPSSPNYGYELWITVGDDVNWADEEGVSTIDFAGGLYAVTRVPRVQEPYYAEIFPTWQRLLAWVQNSPYQSASHQWLEEHLRTDDTPEGEWTIDCYAPIEE